MFLRAGQSFSQVVGGGRCIQQERIAVQLVRLLFQQRHGCLHCGFQPLHIATFHHEGVVGLCVHILAVDRHLFRGHALQQLFAACHSQSTGNAEVFQPVQRPFNQTACFLKLCIGVFHHRRNWTLAGFHPVNLIVAQESGRFRKANLALIHRCKGAGFADIGEIVRFQGISRVFVGRNIIR